MKNLKGNGLKSVFFSPLIFIKTNSLIALVLLWFASFEAEARINYPPPTQEQIASIRESELKRTELKIGHDCQPQSTLTKVYLKTLNAQELRYFWLGQRYAVERTYHEKARRLQMIADNNSYDSQIAAIERQRSESNLAALGVKSYSSPKIDRVLSENDARLSALHIRLERSNMEWAEKCHKYADEKSR